MSKEKLELTQEELDKLVEERVKTKLEKELDKRVTKAIKTYEDNQKGKLLEELEKEKEEIERKAKLTEEERLREEFEQERLKFEEERKVFKQEKLSNYTTKRLAEEGIPVKFSNYLLGDDEKVIETNITEFKESWTSELSSAIKERYKGKIPEEVDNRDMDKGLDEQKEEFKAMSYSEKQDLYNTNPDLYNELSK